MNHKLAVMATLACFNVFVALAQENSISGVVKDDRSGLVLPGAVVRWLNVDKATSADQEGMFSIQAIVQAGSNNAAPDTIVTSFVGYQNDTLILSERTGKIQIRLTPAMELQAAEIIGRRASTEISTLQTRGIEILNEGELLKAACCNLSESFETNPSVDVNYTDAVTGAREIQLLGLSGIYTQMLGEAIPTLRGMAAPFGLLYIPGAWMESIQISKGAGSVSNGYEGLTGQINVEFKKPLKVQPLLHLNVYGDAFGRAEVNGIYTLPMKRKWNYMLMAHGSGLQTKWDDNNDGFIDMPLYRQLNVYNRMHFNINNRYEGQLGLKALMEDRDGGQMDFNQQSDHGSQTAYGIGIKTRRIEAYSKTGLIFPEAPYKSGGLQLSGIYHDQTSFFGHQNYNGNQLSFYGNFIYMSVFSTTDHKFKTGLDYRFDRYNESVDDSAFARTESVPGVYFEYTYGCEAMPFGAIIGLRADNHNMFGPLFTPRIHLKYNFTEELILRASAGRAYRYPNTYSDNIGLFTSSKKLVVLEVPKMEDAWNGGLNITSRFRVSGKEGSLMVDAFRTIFNNQWIADQYSSSQFVFYYNLKGSSTANSLQVTTTYEPVLRWIVKLAWRMDDVKTDYQSVSGLSKPLLSRNKMLINLAWNNKKENWRADATLQWEGSKKLPQLAGASDLEIDASPAYYTLMAQVTRIFPKWEAYIGAENLTGFTQKQVIIGSENPFGGNFDANRVWGPVMGRRIYAGLRFNISNNNKSTSK